MAGIFSVASLALFGSAFAAPGLKSARQADDAAASNITLSPVTVPAEDTTTFTPKYNVSLPYGQKETSQFDVGLTTSHASVLLESIASLVSVDCSANTVSLVFDNAADLDAAYSEWSSHTLLVLVTNHMGDCDTELERGFFTAASYSSDASALTLVASTEKASMSDVASYIRTNFTGLPAASVGTSRRALGDITYSPDPITFAEDLVLNATTLYSNDDFTATVDSGYLSLSVTIGGFLTYNVLKSELEELELYIEANTTSDIVLDFGIDLPSNKTFSYVSDVELYSIDIPGVLTFGPEISFSIGAEVLADAAVDVALDLSSSITNGSIVLDYTGNLTASGSWEPTFDVGVTISEAAGVSVTPFITTSLTMAFEILGGAHNASGGIAPQSRFPTTIALDADQEVGGGRSETATVTDKGSAACENGVEVQSNFDFSLDAFVTGRWDDEYAYNVSIPVLDQCFSW